MPLVASHFRYVSAKSRHVGSTTRPVNLPFLSPYRNYNRVQLEIHSTIIMVADPVKWPIVWLNRTFSSRNTTEELLRPELEGTLSQADYEKALDFFPGRQQYLSVRRPTFCKCLLLQCSSLTTGRICIGSKFNYISLWNLVS